MLFFCAVLEEHLKCRSTCCTKRWPILLTLMVSPLTDERVFWHGSCAESYHLDVDADDYVTQKQGLLLYRLLIELRLFV
jgi:hypothetical protein